MRFIIFRYFSPLSHIQIASKTYQHHWDPAPFFYTLENRKGSFQNNHFDLGSWRCSWPKNRKCVSFNCPNVLLSFTSEASVPTDSPLLWMWSQWPADLYCYVHEWVAKPKTQKGVFGHLLLHNCWKMVQYTYHAYVHIILPFCCTLEYFPIVWLLVDFLLVFLQWNLAPVWIIHCFKKVKFPCIFQYFPY